MSATEISMCTPLQPCCAFHQCTKVLSGAHDVSVSGRWYTMQLHTESVSSPSSIAKKTRLARHDKSVSMHLVYKEWRISGILRVI
jgi:hypothetical protein